MVLPNLIRSQSETDTSPSLGGVPHSVNKHWNFVNLVFVAVMNASAARSSAMDRVPASDVAICLWSVSMLPIAPALPALRTHRKHLP